jgi:hypothetical protein
MPWSLADCMQPDRRDLVPGRVAKLGFQYTGEDAREAFGENMWVFIDSRVGYELTGILINDPVFPPDGLARGTRIEFKPRHVWGGMVDDPAMSLDEYLGR